MRGRTECVLHCLVLPCSSICLSRRCVALSRCPFFCDLHTARDTFTHSFSAFKQLKNEKKHIYAAETFELDPFILRLTRSARASGDAEMTARTPFRVMVMMSTLSKWELS